MRSNAIIKVCDDYFHGFQDVCEHASISQTVKGILKILSYVFVVPIAVFGTIYLYNRKVAKIEAALDKTLDNLAAVKIQDVYQKAQGNVNALGITQQQLVSYLAELVVNLQPSNVIEVERFKKGFLLLDFPSQREFFKAIVARDMLAKTFDLIPRNIKSLNLYAGDNVLRYARKNAENARLFLGKLEEFTALERLSLGFRGIGFFTSSANKSLKFMTEHSNVFHAGEEICHEINLNGVVYSYTNDPEPVLRTLIKVRELIRMHPGLKYEIDFANVMIGNSCNVQDTNFSATQKHTPFGTERGVFSNEGAYINSIFEYLNTA